MTKSWGRLCISKSSENDKSEHSLDWVSFTIGKMRDISREITRQEILCRITQNCVENSAAS
ncbi:hypothetical protein X777_10785 [Ooceraea biroi]|uniref:Uncharacterized protein n=1 Tax=Ooceraea biroi TaxID=2015173 RepID=A0A026W3R9_OOCBI|nr:hypothetical protein X777_10785 [Ooceraea biroi]